ncbi:MAG: hypothetical protein ACREEA_12195, partial [Stellaceae bacterium]
VLSGAYEKLEKDSGGLLQIRLLDDYYEHVTFVEGGDYYWKDEGGEKIYQEIAPRTTKPLTEKFNSPRPTSKRR